MQKKRRKEEYGHPQKDPKRIYSGFISATCPIEAFQRVALPCVTSFHSSDARTPLAYSCTPSVSRSWRFTSISLAIIAVACASITVGCLPKIQRCPWLSSLRVLSSSWMKARALSSTSLIPLGVNTVLWRRSWLKQRWPLIPHLARYSNQLLGAINLQYAFKLQCPTMSFGQVLLL